MSDSYPRMPGDEKSPGRTRHVKYINQLSKIASDIPTPFNHNARLAACIVGRSGLISIGVNEKKSHPFQAKYGRNKDSVFLHAETSAIKNALKYITEKELERCTLYICRVKYYDHHKDRMIFGLAKPCLGCFRCITSFGIKKVIYTLDEKGYDFL